MKIKIIAGTLLIAVGITAFIVASGKKEKAIEAETSSFVAETVSAISKDWNADALVSRAEPGLIKAMASQGESVYELFKVYSKLGGPKSDPDCHLKDTSESGASVVYTLASYVCDGEYEHGSATLNLTVRRDNSGGDWKVYYIRVESPYFAEIGYPRTK